MGEFILKRNEQMVASLPTGKLNDLDKRVKALEDSGGSGGGTPASSVTDETTYGITPAVGVSTNYARQDHTHGTPETPTKSTVGLGNVDNTSDANKPVSTATQTALNAKQDTLVSGTNIKTINGNSLLGSGDITISGGAGVSGQATVNFGAVSQEDSYAVVTVNEASVTPTSIISVTPSGAATSDHDSDDYQWDNISGYVSNIINGVSFDIIGVAPNGSWGTYKMNYIIN